METLLWALIGLMVAGFAAVGYLLVKQRRSTAEFDAEKFITQLFEKNEELREKSKAEVNSSVKEMLESNQKQIDLIVKEVRSQLKDSQVQTESLAKQSASIQEQLKQTNDYAKDLYSSTESLKKLLSNNRLRGEWGEQVAENLLIQAGFVENTHYLKQKATIEGRPDFTLLLPDGTKLNIDVKFAYDHLQSYQEAQERQDTEAMKTHLKNFEQSIKTKIKDITSKDYINPESGTFDFVIMFIPNEMIFSFIYEKVPSIIEECNKKRVMMTGPFGFTALLRLILQAHRNFHREKGLKEILGFIDQFQQEYERFAGKMEQLGNQLETVQKTYREVEGTRSRKLTRVVDKIGEYSHQEELLTGGEEEVSLLSGLDRKGRE